MNMDVHRHTPTLAAIDSRGLSTRNVSYHRVQAVDAPQTRITRQAHNAAGLNIAAWDPRLIDMSHGPNQTYAYSLGGLELVSHNVDSGQRIHRYSDAGIRRETWDSRDSHWQTDYDPLLRPVTIYEVTPTHPRRISQRFTYADNSPSNAAHNRCGRLIRHDDGAGSVQTQDYGLKAETLSETRHFLADMEAPDWPSSFTGRDLLLEPGSGASTGWRYSPTGELLERTDAAGHCQTLVHTLAGQVESVTLRTRAGTEHEVFQHAGYNAFGQLERQVAGNGVISRDEYDTADGRLLTRRAERADGSVVQDLGYGYDPVGNIIWIEDHTQPTRHFDNQRIDGISTFTHDTLYQLIEATGREAAGSRIQPDLPAVGGNPADTSQLLNYTEQYRYDAGGNLLQLRHIGKHTQYTRDMQIAPDSNRSLPQIDRRATDFTDEFDGNGNLLKLENGQTLQWNNRNQLRGVVMLSRPGDADNDHERYSYDAQGKRVRKLRITRTGATVRCAEVRYLPGIEIRATQGEHLEVISVEAGHCTLKFLHWTAGKPTGIDNDQLRYGLNDHLNSCSLELDHQAHLLSHEGYYPYGGTAWWTARSAVQASYKTVRYSGKERDASGLYYYGFRYYAPWLQRWINPDPAGDADGLNLYKMVNNSPVTSFDPNGLMYRKAAVVGASAVYAGIQHITNMDHAKTAASTPAIGQPVIKTPGEHKADQWLDKSRQHIMKPEDKITGAFTGRLTAAYRLAQGEVPGMGAIAKGVEVTADIAQFTAQGDVSQIDKTSLAKSAVVDTYNNLGNIVTATKKAVETTAAVATLPMHKQNEIQQELLRRSDETKEGLAISVTTGVGVAGVLDAAAVIAPPGPIKLGIIGTSMLWKVTGVVHTAEELSRIAEQQKDLVSNELGKDAMAQIKASNQKQRNAIFEQVKHLGK